MKALTLWEPWASLVAAGIKKVETRSWAPQHRGWLAIHAAKRPVRPKEWSQEMRKLILGVDLRDGGIWGADAFWPYGNVVAVVNLVAIRKTEQIAPILTREELACGDFTPGRYAWLLHDLWRPREPVLQRGGQGLWDLPDTVVLGPALVTRAPAVLP